jgi:hypothetical protein
MRLGDGCLLQPAYCLGDFIRQRTPMRWARITGPCKTLLRHQPCDAHHWPMQIAQSFTFNRQRSSPFFPMMVWAGRDKRTDVVDEVSKSSRFEAMQLPCQVRYQIPYARDVKAPLSLALGKNSPAADHHRALAAQFAGAVPLVPYRAASRAGNRNRHFSRRNKEFLHFLFSCSSCSTSKRKRDRRR